MRFALTIKNEFRNHKVINLRIVHAMHLLTADERRASTAWHISKSIVIATGAAVGEYWANWIQNAIWMDWKSMRNVYECISRFEKRIQFHSNRALWHSTQLTQCIPNYFDRKLCVFTSNGRMQSRVLSALEGIEWENHVMCGHKWHCAPCTGRTVEP